MSTPIVTLLVVLAALGIALCTAATGAFLAAPPTGDRAMGLVPLLVVAIVASAALALAAVIRAMLGQFAWVHPSPWAAAAIALPLALGVSVCLFAGLLLWAEGGRGFRALHLTVPPTPRSGLPPLPARSTSPPRTWPFARAGPANTSPKAPTPWACSTPSPPPPPR